MKASRGLAVLLPVLALAPPARAQSPESAPAVAADTTPSVVPAALKVPLWQRPWVRPVASLLVPGAGQLLGGRDRGLIYLAAEVWFAARPLALYSQARRERDHFITLGYDVARAPFNPIRLGAPWEYYEAMSHWVESGVFSLGGPGAIRPETDTLTYNGAMWLLARRNYLVNPDSIPPGTDPSYQAAIAFYERRAFTVGYQWSWRNARLEMDTYAQTIRGSDNDYRAATNYLGAILLNHLASAVDALITFRVAGGSVLPRTGVSGSPPSYYLIWSREF